MPRVMMSFETTPKRRPRLLWRIAHFHAERRYNFIDRFGLAAFAVALTQDMYLVSAITLLGSCILSVLTEHYVEARRPNSDEEGS